MKHLIEAIQAQDALKSTLEDVEEALHDLIESQDSKMTHVEEMIRELSHHASEAVARVPAADAGRVYAAEGMAELASSVASVSQAIHSVTTQLSEQQSQINRVLDAVAGITSQSGAGGNADLDRRFADIQSTIERKMEGVFKEVRCACGRMKVVSLRPVPSRGSQTCHDEAREARPHTL